MKTVKLTRTYEPGSEKISELRFRAPTYGKYMQIGPAFEHTPSGVVIYRDAVRQYADELLENVNSGLLPLLDLADALRVEDAIVRFFSEANRRAFASDTSSSEPDSQTVPSNA